MLFMIENGRLGNQLFQYNFLKNLNKNKKKIYLIGFIQLKKILKDKNVTFVNNFLVIFFIN